MVISSLKKYSFNLIEMFRFPLIVFDFSLEKILPNHTGVSVNRLPMFFLCRFLQVLVRLIVDYVNMAAKEHALLNRIEAATSEQERQRLELLSTRNQLTATLLPIRTVGVQVAVSFDFFSAVWNSGFQPFLFIPASP